MSRSIWLPQVLPVIEYWLASGPDRLGVMLEPTLPVLAMKVYEPVEPIATVPKSRLVSGVVLAVLRGSMFATAATLVP